MGVAALILLVTLALALAWVNLRPANYTARAPVLVDVRMDPVGGTPLQGMVAPSYMSTQIDIVKSERVAERVLAAAAGRPGAHAALARSGAARSLRRKQWLAQRDRSRAGGQAGAREQHHQHLLDRAQPGRGGARGERVRPGLPRHQPGTQDQPGQEATRNGSTSRSRRRATGWRRRRQKLSAFQEQAGIVSSDERGDYETARLTELSSSCCGRRAAAARRRTDTSPGVMQPAGQQHARRRRQARIQGAGRRARPWDRTIRRCSACRPSWQRCAGRLAQESARVGSASAASGEAGRARERELQQAVAAQKGARDRDQQAARRTHRAAARSGHRAEGLRDRERQRGRSRACRA